MKRLFLAMALMAVPAALALNPAAAGMADVVAVEVTPESRSGGETSYRFSVTIQHADEGWDHYADAFEVVAPDGTVLGVRVLAHPHENEQPFTRSLGGVGVPEDVPEVTIRARDSVHGYGGETVRVALPKR